jgi:hypothetical protein
MLCGATVGQLLAALLKEMKDETDKGRWYV